MKAAILFGEILPKKQVKKDFSKVVFDRADIYITAG